ncbi:MULTISPECIES: VanW family protein [unclassified Clostridioides]|uniref:VanW family protein n=1 Tax=unclassified Clostridioides TaxID=2635829 RepID=UPI001D0F8DB5|nr:VanW family protein [Clostridioides sp. ZZV14-6150]MCC0658705.1 VanW family protein [Clostridioides sp. ZZV14-6154]MCC0719719.1 VanW family protein [Clostridioides sp. ZZV14-6105]MCC0721700.1 VanW family protein [Clostridioides sp. ZZV14-6104]MCC0725116.1 VanW family protein [Clostridioides sp. ZZV14-6045]MCC0731866.1 VanW family protein [Clostridioides sp. ZZV14-6048]MCC0733572.1 VanW family protein [Clostridioides sp. ZZV14-6009]MCC0736910.1 VanW family protein [Clostridioides sp. ZZV14
MSRSTTRVSKLGKEKKRTFIIVLAVLAVAIGVSTYFFNNKFLYNGKIAKNVYIEDINVSDMTKEEALKAITDKYTPEDLNLTYDGKDYKISPNDIDLKYNTEEVVKNAYESTKKGSYFQNLKKYIDIRINKLALKIESGYDEAKLSAQVSSVADSINVKMKNASISVGSGGLNYTESVVGREFDLASNKESIYNMIKNKEYKSLELKVNLQKPDITTEQVKSVNSVIGQYSTTYSQSVSGRAYNVALSARKTSDVLLMPGEEFSYNKLTGPSNKANGYKDAPVIVYGKLEQSAGGGVCQTSSTVYNAALLSGMEITQVTNHSSASTYVPRGRDATVSDGGLNLKFKNPYNHPVYIKNYAGGGSVSSIVYGNSGDKPNISIEVKNTGKDKYSTYRVYKDSSGKVIKREHISNSSYKELKK